MALLWFCYPSLCYRVIIVPLWRSNRAISALLSHFCRSVIGLLLRCSRAVVALLFRCCCSVVALLSRCNCAVVALLSRCCRAVVALLLGCCCTVATLWFDFHPFNSFSTFLLLFFLRCKRIVASAVFSFYNVFQLEFKSYFKTSCKVFLPSCILPHLSCKGFSALLFLPRLLCDAVH